MKPFFILPFIGKTKKDSWTEMLPYLTAETGRLGRRLCAGVLSIGESARRERKRTLKGSEIAHGQRITARSAKKMD